MIHATVEQYLDQLFDRLAGTGRHGRRVLTEAEAHLTESAETLLRQGRPPDEAAREAIARFGSPETVAKAAMSAGILPFRLLVRRIMAAAWLVGSIGLASFGLSGMLDWWFGTMFGPGIVAPDAPGQTYSTARCADLLAAYPHATTCQAASVVHHYGELIYRPISASMLGCISLLLFLLARRSRRFRGLTILPPFGLVALMGVMAFGSAAAVLVVFVLERLQIDQTWGVGAVLARAMALMSAALILLPGAWRELRGRVAR